MKHEYLKNSMQHRIARKNLMENFRNNFLQNQNQTKFKKTVASELRSSSVAQKIQQYSNMSLSKEGSVKTVLNKGLNLRASMNQIDKGSLDEADSDYRVIMGQTADTYSQLPRIKES